MPRLNQALPVPELTFSKIIIGFEEWFRSNYNEILSNFDATAKYFFEDSIEDFAVEIFFSS
jgi:hypothetical protein